MKPDDDVNDDIDAAYGANDDRYSARYVDSDDRPGSASGDDEAGAAVTSRAVPTARVSRSLSLATARPRAR